MPEGFPAVNVAKAALNDTVLFGMYTFLVVFLVCILAAPLIKTVSGLAALIVSFPPARKILIGLVGLVALFFVGAPIAFRNHVAPDSDEKVAPTSTKEIEPDPYGSSLVRDFNGGAKLFLEKMQQPWSGKGSYTSPDMRSTFSLPPLAEPLYVNPKLVPSPTPAERDLKRGSRNPSLPAPTPVPVQPDTLYTSK